MWPRKDFAQREDVTRDCSSFGFRFGKATIPYQKLFFQCEGKKKAVQARTLLRLMMNLMLTDALMDGITAQSRSCLAHPPTPQ